MGRNRRPKQRPKQRPAKPAEPHTVQAEIVDVPGGLLQDPHKMRSDTQIVARMYAAGVVPIEVSTKILAAAYALAAKAVSEDKRRDYVSLMRVIEGAAKMHERMTTERPTVHQHLHAHGDLNHRTNKLSQITAQLGFTDLAERYRQP